MDYIFQNNFKGRRSMLLNFMKLGHF